MEHKHCNVQCFASECNRHFTWLSTYCWGKVVSATAELLLILLLLLLLLAVLAAVVVLEVVAVVAIVVVKE